MKITRILAALDVALMASAALAANDGVSTTPTIQTAAYSSGNAIGGLQTVPFFRSAYLSPSGVLDEVDLTSNCGSTIPITFYIFDTNPTATTCTDKSAFSLGAADVAKLAVQPFTLTPAATTGTSVASAQLVQATSVANQDTPAKGRVLYVCLVVGGSVTPASTTDLQFKLSGAFD
ncbi:hypothetical protein SAMN05443247_04697 [Bradyrhizobium erythrophlei]|nr:hypothetical protein SAMN05443247_04697 [Bradyrhizobium erythrophlei]